MAENRGKKFESTIRSSFERVKNTTVIRMPDPTNGYLGIRNICDFIIYHYPYQYFIECKSVHGNTLPIRNITVNQRKGLAEVASTKGVIAGVICWWVDLNETWFIPIWVIQDAERVGVKSINLKKPYCQGYWIYISGKKKRVFYDYNMSKFFEHIEFKERSMKNGRNHDQWR